jgi:hypothetical protein
MNEKWSRRGALAWLAVLAAPLSARAAPARIPLRQQAGKLWVPVTVNGHAAEAILDTGAARSSLDAAFAAQAGIATRGRFTGQMIQGRVPGAHARDVKVRLGDVVVEAKGAVAVDYGPLSRTFGRPVQVVLGRELFESFVVVVDVEHGEAEVLPREGFAPPANGRLIALRPARGRMAAPIAVEDQRLWAMVDIGNDLPLIVSPSPAARRLLQGRPVSTALIGGEGSSVVAEVATARRLEFGSYSLPAAPFQVAPRGLGADANLGLPVLRRFRLTLDFGGRRMWLEPGLNLAFPFARDRTGLNGFIDGGTLRILYVARGGPAERAGFKAGDVVTAIDGENAAVANAALAGAPAGRTLDFTLADGSHRRLTLADYY